MRLERARAVTVGLLLIGFVVGVFAAVVIATIAALT